MSFKIRPYHPTDLPMLYRICLETGDNGRDASHLFRDPDLLGHFYAGPYAILEPELTFVLTHNGRPCGYTLGVADTATFGKRCETEWFPPLRQAYPLPQADENSHDAGMIRHIHTGHNKVNEPAGYPAHLHIDILPEGQGQGCGTKLINTLLDELRRRGIEGVHLGVSAENKRAIGFYEHVGFQRLSDHDWGKIYGMKLT